MKIIKYKKVGMDKYKVEFENTDMILHEDVILKYNLLCKDSISIEELEKIIDDNKYYDIYSIALKYINIKLRSKKEIKAYLLKKEFDVELVEKVINNLECDGYINEIQYIEAYINDCVNLKSIGPLLIKEELINLCLDEEKINKYISIIDENVWDNKIKKYVCKILNSSKKYSTNMLKQKIVNDLYIKGFPKEMIIPYVENININDEDSLNKEYEKVYKKYSSKYSGKELENKIVCFLSRKGYDYKDIFNIFK